MINWSDIEIRSGQTGQIKTICPACSPERKNKKDRCLSVNIDSGVARCHHCNEISVKNPQKQEQKNYDAPAQDWTNYTSLSDNLVKWYKERGISQKTLIECKITEEEYYQPSAGKKMNNAVFNYFEGNKLVNKKYRSANKQFTQTKNAKKVFYGINDIIGCEEIYIVEGENDKLAFWEIGIKNCVSVPNGANDLNDIFDTCGDYLRDIKKVYIAVDMDDAGTSLEKGLIRRFSKWRCSRIIFTEKDANDQLKMDRLEFEKIVNSPVDYPVEGTFTASDLKNDILDYYENGLEECWEPKRECYRELNKIFKVLPGQLTTVTGIPSHGKSNFIEGYVMDLVNDLNLKASFYSPEHLPMKTHVGVLAEKVIGKPFLHNYNSFMEKDEVPRMSKTEVNDYIEWSKDKIFLTSPEKGERPDWKWLMETFKEQIFRFGIEIFVIDAFNKPRRKNPESIHEIGDILADLCLFAQAHEVHIFLIAHPTKMRKNQDGVYEVPDLYSVKGTGDFRDQSHNGLSIYRHFDNKETGVPGWTEVHNLKTKFKHQGEIGAHAEFLFDKANNRYYSSATMRKDRLPLFDKREQTEMNLTPISEVKPDSECPF